MNGLTTVDRGLALQLADCVVGGGSGIATAVRGKLRRLFCIERGRLVHAASNVIEEQLPELLIRSGLLKPDDLVAAQNEAERLGTRLSRLLLDSGVVPQENLESTLRDHVRTLLFTTMSWPDGECHLERGMPDLRQEVRLDLSCVSLLVEYAGQHPAALAEVRARIGPPNARPAFCAAREALLDALEPGPAMRHLLEKCDGTRPAAEIIGLSPEPPEATWRALYALVLLGVIEMDARQKRREIRPEGTVTRAEVEARLERSANADHYAVLGLNPTCLQEEIRDAYYYLARRYHPDRFRAGSLANMLERIESYFTQVTEAYNTLYDAERRRVYDEQRESGATRAPDAPQDTRYLAQQNFLRARGLIERGRRAEAVQYLENAIQLDDGHAPYHLELGRGLSANPRRRQDAETHLKRANELEPARPEGYLALGELYLKTERKPDAIRMFREVLRWEPGHIEAALRLDELGVKE